MMLYYRKNATFVKKCCLENIRKLFDAQNWTRKDSVEIQQSGIFLSFLPFKLMQKLGIFTIGLLKFLVCALFNN